MRKKAEETWVMTNDQSNAESTKLDPGPVRDASYTDPIPLKDYSTNQPTKEEYMDLGAGE